MNSFLFPDRVAEEAARIRQQPKPKPEKKPKATAAQVQAVIIPAGVYQLVQTITLPCSPDELEASLKRLPDAVLAPPSTRTRKRRQPGGDITANNHGGNLMSEEAFEKIRGKLGRIVKRIVEYVDSTGAVGATSEECTNALGLKHQTSSARFSEAKADSVLLVVPGRFRMTEGKCRAAVMVTPNHYAAALTYNDPHNAPKENQNG